jgi:hypothetical protein
MAKMKTTTEPHPIVLKTLLLLKTPHITGYGKLRLQREQKLVCETNQDYMGNKKN